LTELNQKGAVRDYFQSVGGYFTTEREYEDEIPSQFLWAAQPLTSEHFYAFESPFPDVYKKDVNGNLIIPLTLLDTYIRPEFELSSDKHSVYMTSDGQVVSSSSLATKILEPGSYVSSLKQENIPNIARRFPNELRPTAEPKEGFADSFANYLLSFTEHNFTNEGENEDNLFLWINQLGS
jgi:hypothetical protein